MAKVSEVFGGGYLKAEHLNGQPRTYKMDGVGTETIFGKQEYVVYLAGEKRPLRLSNNTIAQDIATALVLDDMDSWSGHHIELYPENRKIPDKETQAEKIITMIRARASANLPPARGSLPDDEIPF